MAVALPARNRTFRQSRRDILELGRPNMFRKAKLALAASLMTFAAFGTTVGIMSSGGAGTVQVA